MQRFNAFSFYRAGYVLHRLTDIPAGAKLDDWIHEFVWAEDWLSRIKRDELVPITLSRHACTELINELDSIIPLLKELPSTAAETRIRLAMSFGIPKKAREFEHILAAELHDLNTYFIKQKAIYSTPDLIERADRILPELVRIAIPSTARNDLIEAGKCLAFDVPTAAAFHTLRAVEAVMRMYYESVVGKLPPTKTRNWGTYISALKKHNADSKVTGALDQIRELHRNPVLHPEETLTSEEATTLFGIAQSAIVAMVQAIPKKNP